MNAIYAVQNCIKDIRTWKTVDKFKLNEDKTEFIVIGTRAQLNKVKISQLTIGHASVPTVTSVRNLGSWFDCHDNASLTNPANPCYTICIISDVLESFQATTSLSPWYKL